MLLRAAGTPHSSAENMSDKQSIVIALGDPDNPAGILTITERTTGLIAEGEYQDCVINPVRKCTKAIPIYENENELVEKFKHCKQEPIVILRNPSDHSPNILLLEDARYYIGISSDSGPITDPLSDLQKLTERVPTKDENEQLYAITFPSYAGRGTFDVTIGGKRYEVPFEVRCTKIEYVKEYPLMLSQISDFLAGLLLSSDSPLSERYALGDHQSNTYYEDFILIEYLFSKLDLCNLFGYVCNNIHRELVTEKEDSYDCAAYNITPDAVQDLIAGGCVYPKDGGSICGHFEFSKMINDHSEDTFDTPENRLVKEFLLTLLTMLDSIPSNEIEGYVQYSVKEKKEKVQSMLSEWWLKDVGKLQHIPFNSNVLNSKYGYADIFNMYLMLGLNLEFKVNDAKFLFEGHTNKVSQTYEYWCYIKIFEALCNLSGKPMEYKRKLQKKWGLSIRGEAPILFQIPIPGREDVEVKLYYNRCTKKGTSIVSYSVELRPDFTLLIKDYDSLKIINFDSKYKFQEIDHNEEDSTEIEDDDLLTTTCKRADLYKMHTYKDAIYHCWGSYVLYPGNKTTTYPQELSLDWEDKQVPSIGAFSLSPLSENMQNFTNQLQSIIIHTLSINYNEIDLKQAF